MTLKVRIFLCVLLSLLSGVAVIRASFCPALPVTLLASAKSGMYANAVLCTRRPRPDDPCQKTALLCAAALCALAALLTGIVAFCD